jgi:two-component system, OmpR family, sensor histidine kinase BaeS
VTISRLSPPGLRLAAAFVVVAAVALAVFVVLLLAATRAQVDDLVAAQHEADAAAAAASAADAYAAAGSWEGADLTAAAAIAARGQASLVVADAQGVIVAAATAQAAQMMSQMHGVEVVEVPRGHPVIETVMVDGQPVGAVHLAYPLSGLPPAEQQVRDSLSRVALLGAVLAGLAAVAMALFVAGRVTRPVVALTDAAAQLEGGRRDVRVDLPDAPGELGQLAAAFNRMATAVADQDELRRRLVADVAHEVRTPLTILRGTTEGLVDGVLPSDASTLSSLHEEVLRLTGLVEDLEVLAAADAAGLALDLSHLDLAEVAATAVTLARPAAADAGLDLVDDLSSAPVAGDERRLTQVVTNLLANAIAYTPPGGTVTVMTARRDGASVLAVADTGPGLAPGEAEEVFERFFRGTAGRATSGSGIGLAIAADLVEAHGGRITAENRPSAGALFTITLPCSEGRAQDGFAADAIR